MIRSKFERISIPADCVSCVSGKNKRRLCSKHYRQIRQAGVIYRTRNDPNKISCSGGVCSMELYSSEQNGCVLVATAIFDEADLPLVAQFKWGPRKFGRHNIIYYAYTGQYEKGKPIALHQLILGRREGYVVDHINGDGLDNRRANLRHLTHLENMNNTYYIRALSLQR